MLNNGFIENYPKDFNPLEIIASYKGLEYISFTLS